MKRNPQKLPSLDGWRMVSISLVLLGHSVYTASFPSWARPIIDWFDPGDLGVRFFFVISGFLITWLLLQEQIKNGCVRPKNFYIRRALRILPVYFLYLLVLGLFTHYSQDRFAWLANLSFTTNFFETPFPTAHLWSLGVEEQFYLLWPWLLIWALRRRDGHFNPCLSGLPAFPRSAALEVGEASSLFRYGKRQDAAPTSFRGVANRPDKHDFNLPRALLVPLVVAPLVRLLSWKHWYPGPMEVLFQSGSFLARFDALAYGCIAAVLFTYARNAMESFYQRHSRDILAGGMILILTPPALQFFPFHESVLAAVGPPIQAIGFSLVLLQSVLYPGRGFYPSLNWKWVSHLGVLSYSIYIWQEMFCGTGKLVFGVTGAWWTDFPIWILNALLAAHLSFYAIERPLLGLRARYRAV